jgi:hypothetical protein
MGDQQGLDLAVVAGPLRRLSQMQATRAINKY